MCSDNLTDKQSEILFNRDVLISPAEKRKTVLFIAMISLAIVVLVAIIKFII